jgi:hypothetical protein
VYTVAFVGGKLVPNNCKGSLKRRAFFVSVSDQHRDAQNHKSVRVVCVETEPPSVRYRPPGAPFLPRWLNPRKRMPKETNQVRLIGC